MAQQVIIRGGAVCDGSGKEPVPQDVLIKDGRIAAVASPGTFDSVEGGIINADGKIVAPGFIDAHSHNEAVKLKFPCNRSKLLQGITTEVDGNCGNSRASSPDSVAGKSWKNLPEYVKVLQDSPASTNTVILCGHNTIRDTVMGKRNDRASAVELKAMQKILEESLSAGAAGWSSGLTYFPGKFSDTAELSELNRITRGSKKVYASHIRSEGDKLIESVEEALEIGRAGSGRVQISHLKTIFQHNFHKIDRLMEVIESARSNGGYIHADRYPYIYSSTNIGQALPYPYNQDTAIAEKLRASSAFQDEITEALKGCPRNLPEAIIVSEGRTLSEIAAAEDISVERACMEQLMEEPMPFAAFKCMSEDNLMRILSAPWVCAGSDGISHPLDDPADSGHPRAVGSMPRFFRLTSSLCGIGEAVRRMTSLPAEIFSIPERGLVREGFVADLVIFDGEKLDSRAGFRGEDLLPIGIDRVIVNGNTAWDSANPGEVGCYGKFIPAG